MKFDNDFNYNIRLHYYSLKWWKTLIILASRLKDLTKVPKRIANLRLRGNHRVIYQAANRPRALRRASIAQEVIPVPQHLKRGPTAILGVRSLKKGIKKKREFSVNAPTGRGEETIREMRDALPADATRTAHR